MTSRLRGLRDSRRSAAAKCRRLAEMAREIDRRWRQVTRNPDARRRMAPLAAYLEKAAADGEDAAEAALARLRPAFEAAARNRRDRLT